MNAQAYAIAAKAAREAMQGGETDPVILLNLAMDAMIDAGVVPMNDAGDLEDDQAQDAIDSVGKALQDLGILPTEPDEAK
jgi:hypothetical protein